MPAHAATLHLPVPPGGLSLRHTLACGQVFCWREEGPGLWRGWIGDCPAQCRIAASGDGPVLELQFPGRPASENEVRRYFGLDDDLDAMIATFPGDRWMRQAVAFARGLRLVRQTPWQAIASFICSAVKQVPHIQRMDASLRERFGRRVRGGHCFPSAEAVAAARESQLRAAGLGFRAPNLRRAARQILDGAIDLEAIGRMPDETALAELQKLAGVGPKIAHCVLLFGYGRQRAFPIDTWIGKALRQLYYPRRRLSVAFLQTAGRDRFGPFPGLAQQYLFHWLRHEGRRHLPASGARSKTQPGQETPRPRTDAGDGAPPRYPPGALAGRPTP